MSRWTTLVVTVAFGSCFPGLAMASAQDPSAALAFAQPAMSDAALDSVRGSGLGTGAFVKAASRGEAEALGRFSAETLPVIFDNWFNDNGSPLIAANLSR